MPYAHSQNKQKIQFIWNENYYRIREKKMLKQHVSHMYE